MKRRIIMTCCLFFSLFIGNQTLMAETVEQYSSVSFSAKDGEAGGVIITGDSTGKEEGYYTSYVYGNIGKVLTDYAGFFVTLFNEGNGPVMVVPSIHSGTVYSMPYEDSMFLEEKKNALYIRKMQNKGIYLKKGKRMRVYIPLSSLDGKADLDKFCRTGFIVSIAENISCNLSVSRLEWKTWDEMGQYEDGLKAEITGGTSMQIAVQGESVLPLSITGGMKEEYYTFRLKKKTPGVSVAEDGRVIVTKEAEPGKITVLAESPVGLLCENVIELYEAWTVTMDADTRIPDEVSKDMGIPFWTDFYAKVKRNIQAGVFVSSFITLGLYQIVRQTQKRKSGGNR